MTSIMSTNKFIKEKKRFEPNRYALPQYWIRLQTNVQIFLDRLEKRIKTNSPLKFSRYKQSFLPGERLDRLFLEIGNGKYYHDLNIVAWVESKNKRIVGVDARASWRIKDPPSSQLYDRIISKFFSPLLETYNKHFNSDLQLEKGNFYTGAVSFAYRGNYVVQEIRCPLSSQSIQTTWLG